MFFLKQRNHDYVNCDEFGWWLTGSKPVEVAQSLYEEILTTDEINSADLQRTNNIIPSTRSDEKNSLVFIQDSSAVADLVKEKTPSDSDPLKDLVSTENLTNENLEEISFAEEPPCKASSRSYTPERLVRTQDYKILTRSQTFSYPPQTEPSTPISTPCKKYSKKRYRCLNHLIDKQLIGASQLEALLDPDAVDIKIPVVVSRRKLYKDRSSFASKDNLLANDLLAIANSESPIRSSTPDLMSSGSSCERLNNELHSRDSIENDFDQEFKTTENFFENKLLKDDSFNPSGFIPCKITNQDDPEIVLQNLKVKIDDIRKMNKDIFGDVSLLRRNFQWEETKTGNLTTETTRLRQEIRDLRYLDDLVNLLQGELERISRKNWPFKLGHEEDHNCEEINLVI